MTKDNFQVNLPVKDINSSKMFYSKLGFTVHSEVTDDLAMFYIGRIYIGIMLFSEPEFKNSLDNKISDTKKGIGVYFDIELESKEELYELAINVKNAGGTIYEGPNGIDGKLSSHWLKFADLDGHLWNVKYLQVHIE